MLAVFCRTLSAALGPQGKLPDLDQTMVAGYRSAIFMYKNPDNTQDAGAQKFFNKTKTASVFSSDALKNTATARNTIQDGKSLSETHPKGADAGSLATFLQDIPTQEKAKRQYLSKNAEQQKIYNTAALYIQQKLVLKFSAASGQWTQVSIAEYTDNDNIRGMVQVVQPEMVKRGEFPDAYVVL